MIDLNKLEVISIKSMSKTDLDYFQRRVCRYYSENFHTPLLEVYQLPWVFVYTNYIEHVIEKHRSKDEIHELAIELCYPEKIQAEEEEIQDWIRRIEKEEEERRQKEKKKKEKAEENISMQSTSFEHLEKEMEEDEY